MPARIDNFWEERVKSLKANNPTWGAVLIHRELQTEATVAGRTDEPSQRWVGAYLKNKWPSMTYEQQADYRAFFWPESMLRGELPWEASGVGLELLAFLDANGWLVARPPIRLVRWFWRVTQICPEESVLNRATVAGNLAYQELSGSPSNDRSWEWWLAYSRAEGEAREDREILYLLALEREEKPLPPTVSLLGTEDIPDEEGPDETFLEIFLIMTGQEARKRRA